MRFHLIIDPWNWFPLCLPSALWMFLTTYPIAKLTPGTTEAKVPSPQSAILQRRHGLIVTGEHCLRIYKTRGENQWHIHGNFLGMEALGSVFVECFTGAAVSTTPQTQQCHGGMWWQSLPKQMQQIRAVQNREIICVGRSPVQQKGPLRSLHRH